MSTSHFTLVSLRLPQGNHLNGFTLFGITAQQTACLCRQKVESPATFTLFHLQSYPRRKSLIKPQFVDLTLAQFKYYEIKQQHKLQNKSILNNRNMHLHEMKSSLRVTIKH